MIYAFTFTSDHGDEEIEIKDLRAPPCDLLMTCKAIYHEAFPFFDNAMKLFRSGIHRYNVTLDFDVIPTSLVPREMAKLFSGPSNLPRSNSLTLKISKTCRYGLRNFTIRAEIDEYGKAVLRWADETNVNGFTMGMLSHYLFKSSILPEKQTVSNAGGLNIHACMYCAFDALAQTAGLPSIDEFWKGMDADDQLDAEMAE